MLPVIGIAAMLAACSSTPVVSGHSPTPLPATTVTPTPAATAEATPAATPAPSPAPVGATPTPSPAANPVLTALTAADLATVTSVYLSYRESDPNNPGLYPPGSIAVYQSHATLMPDGGVWALVEFRLTSSTPTLQQQVGMQDGGGTAVFLRLPGNSTWLLRGIAGNPACASVPEIGVPAAAYTLWGISTTCP